MIPEIHIWEFTLNWYDIIVSAGLIVITFIGYLINEKNNYPFFSKKNYRLKVILFFFSMFIVAFIGARILSLVELSISNVKINVSLNTLFRALIFGDYVGEDTNDELTEYTTPYRKV